MPPNSFSRDDIVFFIFVYQRWIYKVDKKRVNEFGYSGEMLDGKQKTDQVAVSNGEASAEKTATEKKDD